VLDFGLEPEFAVDCANASRSRPMPRRRSCGRLSLSFDQSLEILLGEPR
jgi:hypothetical protein